MAKAAPIWSSLSTRLMIACSLGPRRLDRPAESAATTYSTGICACGGSRRAFTMRSIEVRQRPTSDSTTILRRSSASAIAPPHSPHTTIGTNSARLTSPTAT